MGETVQALGVNSQHSLHVQEKSANNTVRQECNTPYIVYIVQNIAVFPFFRVCFLWLIHAYCAC
jgi:hypothetical protein